MVGWFHRSNSGNKISHNTLMYRGVQRKEDFAHEVQQCTKGVFSYKL